MTNQRRGLGSRDPLSTNHSSPGHEERYEEQHGHPPADLVRESARGEHAHTRAREEGEASDPVRRVRSIISNNIIIIIIFINIIININAIIFILIINDTIFTITSTSPFSPFSFLPDHTHHYHKSSYHHHYNHHHYITC